MLHKNLEKVLNDTYQEATARDHAYITVEHLLFAILEHEEGKTIIENVGGDVEGVKEDLNDYLGTLEKRTHSEEVPLQTIAFQRILQRAIMHVQNSSKPEVEIGDVIVAIYDEEENEASYYLKKSGIERLAILEFISSLSADNFNDDYGDDAGGDMDKEPGLSSSEPESQKSGENIYLSKYSLEMTEMARLNKYDTVIGRDNEIARTIEILCRRKKNNPIFIGDPGVGKTAIVQGLAGRIVEGKVPDRLKGYHIYSLDIGLLVAGTKYRGDFEKRIKSLLSEVKSKKNALLFIDEIHTLVGAGSVGAGSLDASNILKPLLTSGEIRCLGATTFEEYRKHIEKDRALSRRLQKIDVTEPGQEDSVKILHGLRKRYEEFHQVKYTDEALAACVEFSSLYLRDRFLPDKAIDLMDETGASVSIYQSGKRLIKRDDIIKTLSRMTGIAISRLEASDIELLAGLPERMKKKIFGQEKAIDSLVGVIKKHYAGMSRKDKPVGSFLLTGPTGVGKTELCKVLSEELNLELIRFDMTEYAEKHSISRLLGSPPGYVGYEQGALLTDAVRRKPNAVILLDEIEKAHPDIFNVLLQVFDRAVVMDSTGKNADFRNNIIIMTSNAGSRDMSTAKIGFESKVEYGDAMREVKRIFSPEFINRLDEIIVFGHLNNELAHKIVKKALGVLSEQLKEKAIETEFDEDLVGYLVKKGFDPVNGARPLETLIEKEVKSPVVEEILFGKLKKGGRLILGIKANKVFFKMNRAASAKNTVQRKTGKVKKESSVSKASV